jgi:hypothetical protein
MSPHHFAKLSKNHHISESEREYEEKIETSIKAIVAVIAVPFKKIIGK